MAADFVLTAIGDGRLSPELEALKVDVRPIVAAAGAFREALEPLRGQGGAVLTGPARLSPAFERYVTEALALMARDPAVAFASLGAYRLRPFDRLPFTTLLDGADGVYLRAPPLFGMVLGPTQVEAARDAAAKGSDPLAFLAQGVGLFPRAPVAVGVPATDLCSQNIDRGERQWSLVEPASSLARYDRWFELESDVLLALSPILAEAVGSRSLVVDLFGVRPLDSGDSLVLTTRGCRNPVLSFGLELQPVEANVAAAVPGEVIRLAHRADVQPTSRPFRGYLRRHVGRAVDMIAYMHSVLSGNG